MPIAAIERSYDGGSTMTKGIATRKHPNVGDIVRVNNETTGVQIEGTVEDILSAQFTYRCNDTDRLLFAFYSDDWVLISSR